ncbi:MAG: hypothetical protein Q7R90_05230 [bacterium]|nr:hypothetical protein [bacterium]
MSLNGECSNKGFSLRVGEDTCLVGGAGSRRVTGLLEQSLDFANPPSTAASPMEVMRWLTIDVIDQIRSILKKGGVLTTKEGVDSFPNAFLVCMRSRLYEIQADFSVRCVLEKYAAIGSGAPGACGIFFAMDRLNIVVDPETLVRAALAASESTTPSVRGPFTVIHS